jgi:hypothetical protein
MSGLKLQVLSNPSPSFIIGNPQAGKAPKKKGLAKNRRKRENQGMSKRRRKPATPRRRRKNPFEAILSKGGKKTHVGPFLTKHEIAKDRKAIKYLNKEIKKLRKSGSATPAVTRAIQEKLSRFRAMSAQSRSARKHLKKVHSEIKKLKAQGWRSAGQKKVSGAHLVSRRPAHKARKGKLSGFAAAEASWSRKPSRKAKSKRKAKKSSKAKARKGGKGRSKSKARFGGWRIAGREGQYMIMKGPGGKTKLYKIKKRGKAKKAKKNPSRRRKHAHGLRKHTSKRSRHRLSKNPRRRRGQSKRHGKRRRKVRRNPFGGAIMGLKQILKTTAMGGVPGQAGYIGSANMAIAAATSGLAGAALTKLLDKATGGKVSAMGTAAGPVGAVVSVLPSFLIAALIEGAGEKVKNERVKKIGQAAALLAVADLVQGLAGGAIEGVAAAAGLSGVSYTPMGRRRSGLHGVSFTKNHMGAVPRGLSAIPRGIGSYMTSPGGTLSTDADFGALPHGLRGLTHRDNADFGASRQAADFGGVDFTMGAYPSMRGAHTGDVQYAPSDDQPGSDDDQTNESNDHTV